MLDLVDTSEATRKPLHHSGELLLRLDEMRSWAWCTMDFFGEISMEKQLISTTYAAY